MTNKERLLYQAAINILYDKCQPENKYYMCKNCPDETEEPACERCWGDYLMDVINR